MALEIVGLDILGAARGGDPKTQQLRARVATARKAATAKAQTAKAAAAKAIAAAQAAARRAGAAPARSAAMRLADAAKEAQRHVAQQAARISRVAIHGVGNPMAARDPARDAFWQQLVFDASELESTSNDLQALIDAIAQLQQQIQALQAGGGAAADSGVAPAAAAPAADAGEAPAAEEEAAPESDLEAMLLDDLTASADEGGGEDFAEMMGLDILDAAGKLVSQFTGVPTAEEARASQQAAAAKAAAAQRFEAEKAAEQRKTRLMVAGLSVAGLGAIYLLGRR